MPARSVLAMPPLLLDPAEANPCIRHRGVPRTARPRSARAFTCSPSPRIVVAPERASWSRALLRSTPGESAVAGSYGLRRSGWPQEEVEAAPPMVPPRRRRAAGEGAVARQEEKVAVAAAMRV
ncbi:hypothetical protein PR202_ga29888 [Eleusine coracana subsp. coracana]|uniref:Uncharacterized protein n=1 Tax=Eleusine coracana subsp. coracana TaxID=191504 RepID=A0AAV5DLZ8_ELECO|nr:hypothetical protein PR202_ga29888 [Eleusine coracana subsp. coracana]